MREPSAASTDSQLAKSTGVGGPERGYDGAKRRIATASPNDPARVERLPAVSEATIYGAMSRRMLRRRAHTATWRICRHGFQQSSTVLRSGAIETALGSE